MKLPAITVRCPEPITTGVTRDTVRIEPTTIHSSRIMVRGASAFRPIGPEIVKPAGNGGSCGFYPTNPVYTCFEVWPRLPDQEIIQKKWIGFSKQVLSVL